MINREACGCAVPHISDRSLEAYFTQPDHLTRHLACKRYAGHQHWMLSVQQTVNRVLNDFNRMSEEQRTTLSLMELIDFHWKRQRCLFETRQHYYEVLAKITDHLLHFLLKKDAEHSNLFWLDTYTTYVEVLGVNLTMTFQVAKWTKQSFILQKYLLNDHPEVLAAYRRLSLVFCNEAFCQLPERIEFIGLLSGRVYPLHPVEKDKEEALDYLHMIKRMIGDKKSAMFSHKWTPTVIH